MVYLYVIQGNKKNVAQNILKNQRFIQRYRQLDNQLQNTIFEYNFYFIQAPTDGYYGPNAKCHEWTCQYYGKC